MSTTSVNELTCTPMNNKSINISNNTNKTKFINTTPNNDDKIRITSIEASSLTTTADNNNIQPYNNDTIVLRANYNNIKVNALIDTGATHTFVNQRFIDKNNIKASTINNRVQLGNGKHDNITEIVNDAIIKLQNRTVKMNTLVLKSMNEKYDIVIGIDFIQQSKLSIDELLLKREMQYISKQTDSQINNTEISINSLSTIEPQLNSIKIDSNFKWQPLESDDEIICSIDNIEIIESPLSSSSSTSTTEYSNTEVTDKVKIDPLSTLTAKQRNFILQFSDTYPSKVPKGLPPIRSIQHDIKLIDNTKIHVRPAYRCSKIQQDVANQTIKDMLDAGIIRRSSSPHGAPILFVKKSDGTYRMVVDYRGINSNTVTDSTHLPNIKDSFDRLEGSKIFSKIDFSSGFHQVRMNESSTELTAFNCRQGHFEFLVMPMGLKNSPATFTKLMQSLFSNVSDDGILIYLDDLMIYSKTESEHYRLLDIVFKTLRKNQLYIKLSKCEFFKSSLQFLGHQITGEGKNPVLEKVKKAVDFPIPKSVKQIQKFNGLLNWYRDFIPNYSQVAYPLTELMKSENKFKWTDVEQQSFDQLKQLLVSAPTLVPSNHQLPFIIHTDASDYAIGAVLEQNSGDGNRPISYMSEKLNEHQINYPTHEKELYSIFRALVNWQCYIEGAEIIVYTDNKGLEYLQSQRTVNQRQVRWLMEIFRHNIKIKYKPGISNTAADALSRRPDYQLNDIQLVNTGGIYRDIIKAQQKDTLCQLLRDGKTVNKNQNTKLPLSVDNNIIHQNNRLYIPKHNRYIISSIINQYHDQQCHIGIEKTIDHIKRSYYWTDLDSDVIQYIRTCLECTKNKPILQHKAGLLQSHSIPVKCWHTITVDFVTGLPRSKSGNDSFVVFVDKLSKMIHIAAMKTTDTAEKFATIMFRTVIKLHGHPQVIISDRDTRFTSKFWVELMRLSGTKLNLSSAYHPMTDGQTERSNQTIELLLKPLMNSKCDNWEENLDLVEYTINNSVNTSTKMTPFYANYHQHPSNPYDYHHSELTSVPAAQQHYSDIVNNINKIKSNLVKAQQQQQLYANRKRSEIKFKVGDLVMLSSKNIRNTEGVDKLRGKFEYGPFKIIEVINDVNYKLDLPSTFRIHNNIHIDRLKLVNSNNDDQFPNRNQYQSPPPPIVNENNQNEYEVEKIIDVKYNNNKQPIKYLIKWKGYSSIENSWEPVDNLIKSIDLIDNFHRQQQSDQNNQLLNRQSPITTRALTKVNNQNSQINNINSMNNNSSSNNKSIYSIRTISEISSNRVSNNNNSNSQSIQPSVSNNNNLESVEAPGRVWVSSVCDSNTKKGVRCRCKTKKGFKCWRHLLSELNIRIKPSLIRGAGLGLYTAVRDFNIGDKITTYKGHLSSTPIHGIYVLQVSNNKYINANESTCLGSFINSCRSNNEANGECNGNNSRFSYNRRTGIVNIIATKKINKGEEVCISYSTGYWSAIDAENRQMRKAIQNSINDMNNSNNSHNVNNNNRSSNNNSNNRVRQSPNVKVLKSIINQNSRYNLRNRNQ